MKSLYSPAIYNFVYGQNIAKIMFKGNIVLLTRSNAGSVSAWDQKQFAKLLSFLWFSLSLSQGRRSTASVARENNLHLVSNFLSDPKEKKN